MGKTNVDLIWSIAELSALFEKSTNMEGFLQNVVELIASHMSANVCSIYLYESESDSLVLRATRGLNPESVGSVRLAVGEGITGQALKELRPIREARAVTSPFFKKVPELKEEHYESFLAVPIKRGLNRIGVMTLQHRKTDYFTDQDAKAMQAIASQLGATLENVEILISIHGEAGRKREVPALGANVVVRCKAASRGVAVGSSVMFGNRRTFIHDFESSAEAVEDALFRFDSALGHTHRQLEALQRKVDETLADVASLIFSAHLLMLKDEGFSGRIRRAVEEGANPENAVIHVVNSYVDLFSKTDSTATQEKTLDVKDLGHRLVRNLKVLREPGHRARAEIDDGDYRNQIIVAGELFPSEVVRISAQHAEGVILEDAGITAHISILARSLSLPVVVTRDARVFSLEDDTNLIVDADTGRIYVEPDRELQHRYQQILEARSKEEPAEEMPAEAARTGDGAEVNVMANINIIHDVRTARRYGATGIGLYRSEFPFLVRSDFPTEAEQFAIYRHIIYSMGSDQVILRTLDIGGDKILPETNLAEANPFLGFRGIRFSLGNPDLFKEQLRAMLRAGKDKELGILLPMVSSVDEFKAARAILNTALSDLESEGVAHNAGPTLGAMVELPSAVSAINDLAREADFLSIGTNDLVMYLLAVDRTNDRVSQMYKHYHPAVLKSLETIVEAAKRHDCPVSICGDMASDPTMLSFLIGIGLRSFSVDPGQIPELKRAIADLRTDRAAQIAHAMLEISSIAEMEEFLHLGNGVQG
ncbi:MAG: phosphoenolpyruvate--protein phosphotransferase [Spirochaetaceae bacterium]